MTTSPADAVGRAFGVAVDYHPERWRCLEPRYGPGEFNEMRKRMARIPAGATLIRNSVSTAPGFQIGNVFVMAGVPMIMRAMLEDVGPRLERGVVVVTRTISAQVGEGRIAADLAQIQRDHTKVTIGSYPYSAEGAAGSNWWSVGGAARRWKRRRKHRSRAGPRRNQVGSNFHLNRNHLLRALTNKSKSA